MDIVVFQWANQIRCFRGYQQYLNDFSGKQIWKAPPVYLRIDQEPIEYIFGEVLPEGTGLLLHIHASICKDIAELVFENLRDGLSFCAF